MAQFYSDVLPASFGRAAIVLSRNPDPRWTDRARNSLRIGGFGGQFILAGRQIRKVDQRLPSTAQQVFTPVISRHVRARMETPHFAELVIPQFQPDFVNRGSGFAA